MVGSVYCFTALLRTTPGYSLEDMLPSILSTSTSQSLIANLLLSLMLPYFQYPTNTHEHTHAQHQPAKRGNPAHWSPSPSLSSCSLSMSMSIVRVRVPEWVLLRSRCTLRYRCIRVFQKVRQMDDRWPIWENSCRCIIITLTLSGRTFDIVERCWRAVRMGNLNLRGTIIAVMIIALRCACGSSRSARIDQNRWALQLEYGS